MTKQQRNEQNVSPATSQLSPPDKKLHPSILWSQDKDHVYMTITCKDGEDLNNIVNKNIEDRKYQILLNNENSCDDKAVGNELYIERHFHYLRLPLYASVDINQCEFKELDDRITTSAILKKLVPGSWPRLASSSERLHFIRIDWSKWNDDDDDSPNDITESTNQQGNQMVHYSNNNNNTKIVSPIPVNLHDGNTKSIPPLIPFGEGSSTAIPVEAADCRDLSNDTVPSLFDELNIDVYWKNQLTLLQRFHTLTKMWNTIPSSSRSTVLRALVELMSESDERLASHVKGGQEALRDLNDDEYSSRQISYSIQIVLQFNEIQDDQQQLNVLKRLFSSVSDFERQIVCSTFI